MLLLTVQSETQLHYSAFARIEPRYCLENKVVLKLAFEIIVYLVGIAAQNIAEQQLIAVVICI